MFGDHHESTPARSPVKKRARTEHESTPASSPLAKRPRTNEPPPDWSSDDDENGEVATIHASEFSGTAQHGFFTSQIAALTSQNQALKSELAAMKSAGARTVTEHEQHQQDVIDDLKARIVELETINKGLERIHDQKAGV